MQNHSCSEQLLPLSQCRKVYVQRDYSESLEVKFLTKVPLEIEDCIDQREFENFVNQLNSHYADAERFGCQSVCETFWSCLTCHLAPLCIPSQFDKRMKDISHFLHTANETLFRPLGLFVTDPIERGLRVLEINILNEPHRRNGNSVA